ncbi:hypothetical protein, conserved, partial [Eimeria maxima]
MKSFVALVAALAAFVPFSGAEDAGIGGPVVAMLQQDATGETFEENEPTAVAVEETEGASPRVFFLDKLLGKFLMSKLKMGAPTPSVTNEHHHMHVHPAPPPPAPCPPPPAPEPLPP